MKKLLSVITSGLIAMMSIGCTSNASQPTSLHLSSDYYNYLQPSFDEYLNKTRNWLAVNRHYISDDHKKELAMNMPFDFRPKAPTNKAVLLVHGLGDSSYSFSDIAQSMVKQGFYVQALLLPGHGSKPSDMMLTDYQDWQTIVDHYAELLKQDYDEVWLGGFSTGGNLVTIHALNKGNVDGLLLFSPGFQSVTPHLEKLTPLIAAFWDGYEVEETNLSRYNSASLNGAIAYSKSASVVRDKLSKQTLTVPTLIAVSEADSIIDADAIKKLFENRFDNPSNQLIWYGQTEQNQQQI